MDDAVTSFINTMGNIGILPRETEGFLTRIVQKGVRHEKEVNERQIELQRIMTPAEIVEMQVRPYCATACCHALPCLGRTRLDFHICDLDYFVNAWSAMVWLQEDTTG